MRTVPSRNPFLVLASVMAAFCAGPALGVAVAHWSAPGCELAQITSPLAFALAFAAGLMLWFGIGVLELLGRLLRSLLRGMPRRLAHDRSQGMVPAGHGAFLPLAAGLGGLAGLVAGIASGSLLAAWSAHALAGVGYGLLLRGLARTGLLPFPEPA